MNLHSTNNCQREKRDTEGKHLRIDYVLGPNDVLCGRGKKCFEHVGNRAFRKIVEATLNHYTSAPTKMEKSFIIREVMNFVCSNSEGGFVRYDPISKRYFKLSENHAREKTSQAYRDALIGIKKGANAAMLRQDERNIYSITMRSFMMQQSTCNSDMLQKSILEFSSGSTSNGTFYQSQTNITSSVNGNQMHELSEIFQSNPTFDRNIIDNRIQSRGTTDLFQIENLENQESMDKITTPPNVKFQEVESLGAGTASGQFVSNQTMLRNADRNNVTNSFTDLFGTARQDYSMDTSFYGPIPVVVTASEAPQDQEPELTWEFLEWMAEQNVDGNPFEPIPIP